MFLMPFFTGNANAIRISALQASRFAKEIAGDFNPLHDPDNKRFCVPGDLLFALVLAHYGVNRRMNFSYAGMLGDGKTLEIPSATGDSFSLQDASGKTYLEVSRSGENCRDQTLIENLTRRYVAFSGQNFPHILVPLMQRHRVMINTVRPLVIYESMSFDLERLDLVEVKLELADSTLEVKGKRGDARLYFKLRSGAEVVGTGFKKLVLSGLRDYDHTAVQGLVDRYSERKAAYGLA